MAVRELVENSFPYQEPLLVRENGRVGVARIGEVVERMLASGEGRTLCVADRWYKHLEEPLEALTLDENYKLAFRRITAVFKHPSPKRLWRISLQNGRVVRTTSVHNVFVLGDDLRIVGKETRFLVPDDRVVVPAGGLVPGDLQEIDLLAELCRLGTSVISRVVVRGAAELYPRRISNSELLLLAMTGGTTTTRQELHAAAIQRGFGKPDNLIHGLRRRGSLATARRGAYGVVEDSHEFEHLYAIKKDWVLCDAVPLDYVISNPPPGLDKGDISFSVKQGRGALPRRVALTSELMRVLGYYSSEGSVHAGYKVSFSFGRHERDTYVVDLVQCLEKALSIKPMITVEHESAVNVVVNDATLALFVESVLGMGSKSSNKRVPWVVFNVKKELAEEYLKAYIRGDGHVQTAKRNKKITIATSSDQLFTDLKFLLSLLGKHYTTSLRRAERRVVNGVETFFKAAHIIYIREGIAPEACAVPISRFRKELVSLADQKSNVYRDTVQKNWLRDNFASEQLPEAVRRLAYSDAGALKVRAVEEYDSQEEWVYDVAVDGVERFIGGEGLALLHNSFDACELYGFLPDIYVRIIPENPGIENTDPAPYRLTVTDNGPGVDPQHVPSAFGKVFYGSKYALRQSRGMFGLGGTMAILYGQITTNAPVKIITSTDGKTKHTFEMLIDISENRPVVLRRETSKANGTTGTRVELTLEGDYLRASPKISDYIRQTAMMASYANLTFVDPTGQVTFFERVTDKMPAAPKETLPHPYGIDVEAFKRIIKLSGKEDMKAFMVTHFHRVGEKIATRFLEFAGIDPQSRPKDLTNQQVVAVVDALQRFPDFLQPDASVLSPVGEEILLAGINKELQPEFSALVARPPSSYSGFPFLVEVGLAYGGKVLQPGVKLFRFANRIPLLYDECYSEDTRVLTKKGFMLFSQLSYEDEIATLNPQTGFLEYQRPTRIISYAHKGPMVHFGSPYVNLMVTPNHRMYCSRPNRPYQFFTAREIQSAFADRKAMTEDRKVAYQEARLLRLNGSSYSSIAVQLSIHKNTVRGWLNGSRKRPRFTKGPRPHFYIKRDAGWTGEWDADYYHLPTPSARRGSHHLQRANDIDLEDWLRFLGWYVVEGSSFRDGGGYVISLGLGEKDLRYKDEIDKCVRALAVNPRWIKKGAHSYEIRFTHRQVYEYVHKLGHARDKYIPPDIKALPRERLEILLDALLKGDGTVSKTGSKVFGTIASFSLASDVAEIALKCGYAVTFGYDKKGICVYLNVKHKSTKLKNAEVVDYDGRVWCATVPNHIMLVERGGKAVWSGNSSDVSFKVLNEEVDWRRYHVPQDAPIAVVTHICLPEYEGVMAEVDGRLCHTQIGNLIDEELQLSQNRETRDGVTYIVPTRAIKVPSVDPETLEIEYVPVKRFMKRPGGPILRITSEEGRILNVSPEHPVLVLSGRRIETKEAERLVDGDYLVAAKSIPRPEWIREVASLDLVAGFANTGLTHEVVVVGGKELLYSGKKGELASVLRTTKYQIDNWRRYDRMPLWAYMILERNVDLRKRIKLLGRRSHGAPIPAIVELDRGFARLLGFYLAEGCSSLKMNNLVSFSFHRDEVSCQDEVITGLVRIFGVNPTRDIKKKDRAVQITAYNKALALFFLKILKAGSDSCAKHVPDFVFSARKEFIQNVLDAYFAGDGYLCRPTRKIQALSSSYDLAQELFVLLKMNGLSSAVYKFGNNYRLDLHGGEDFQAAKHVLVGVVHRKEAESLASLEYRPSAAHRIPVSVFEKDERYPRILLQHVGGRFSTECRLSDVVATNLGLVDSSTRKFVEGDIQFVRVKKVEVKDYHGSYYNIETAREVLPNYMHGFGIFSHNCSTRIPYKTVGKEYIADRPEIERDLRNATREALRRLGLYLSRKGSIEAVQRKMNIYGKYLPLVARFSMELADEKRMPRYRKLIGGGPRKEEREQQPAKETPSEKSEEIEQKKIDEYS